MQLRRITTPQTACTTERRRLLRHSVGLCARGASRQSATLCPACWPFRGGYCAARRRPQRATIDRSIGHAAAESYRIPNARAHETKTSGAFAAKSHTDDAAAGIAHAQRNEVSLLCYAQFSLGRPHAIPLHGATGETMCGHRSTLSAHRDDLASRASRAAWAFIYKPALCDRSNRSDSHLAAAAVADAGGSRPRSTDRIGWFRAATPFAAAAVFGVQAAAIELVQAS